jgi:glycosyltransferase involved in cell wall biosynthesis
MRLKVLHVLPSLDPMMGGVCQAVRNIIKYTSNSFFINEVLCLDDPSASYLENSQFKIHAIGTGKTAWNYNSYMKHWLSSYLSDYDRIIVHGLWQYLSHSVYRAWRRFGSKETKLYVMPHGMLDPYFQKAKGRKIKALRNEIFWKFIEGPLINNSSGVLFTCETEKILAAMSFNPYTPSEEIIVGLGVEVPPKFEPYMSEDFFEKCKAARGTKYLLFLSRIHAKKGVDLLINSYLKLTEIMPELPILVVAGPGLETDFGKQMIALARGNKNIIFTGMLEGSSKWGAFYNCDAFILPSHQENFGIAIVEAMACGKPVLISDQVNIFREIKSCFAGLICKDNQEGVFVMIKEWLNLSELSKRELGDNAISCYNKIYSEKEVSKKFIDILSTH